MKATITPKEDGPLVLTSEDGILFSEDQQLETKNAAFLCRCGHSAKKPFCDGAHNKAGFSSAKEIDQQIIQEYTGREVCITFNRSICAGAAHCVHELPEVFSSQGSENWIFPDQGSLAEIEKTVCSCPSGALTYTVKGERFIDSRTQPKVSIVKNGPYIVESVPFEGAMDALHWSPTKYTLCRCGLSKNKPYCDYSHGEQGWSDAL